MDTRQTGRLFRKMLRLDKEWKAQGKPEGRTANALAGTMGRLARAGVSTTKQYRVKQQRNG